MSYETFEVRSGDHGDECQFCGCALVAAEHVCPDSASRKERQAAYAAAGWDVGQTDTGMLWASRPNEVRYLSAYGRNWHI